MLGVFFLSCINHPMLNFPDTDRFEGVLLLDEPYETPGGVCSAGGSYADENAPYSL